MSRITLASSVLLALATVGVYAADSGNPAPKSHHPAADKPAHHLNSIDPISGTAVNAAIPAVTVTALVNGKSESITITIANTDDAQKIKEASATDKALIIQAAQANAMVREGKVVPAPMPTTHK